MNFDKLTRYLDTLEPVHGIPGFDIRIMQNHRELYRHTAGFSDYEMHVPMNGTELYDIYSATKVITMTAVMQLIEKGLLSLEDNIEKYFPEFAASVVLDDYTLYKDPIPHSAEGRKCHVHREPITIRRLMSMTAGLSYDMENPYFASVNGTDADTLTIVRHIAQFPLLYEPGTRYLYSLAHDVLGAVVELVSGERFADYINAHILHPLGIYGMTMHPTADEQKRLMAQWCYDETTNKVQPSPTGNKYRVSSKIDSGGAGMTASVGDYSIFADALACGGIGANGVRILSEESVRKLGEPQLSPIQVKDFGRDVLGYSYGLGVRTLAFPELSKSPVGEFGWDGAAGAFCLMDLSNRLSIFYNQQILSMGKVYFEIHPTIRDLVYECL